MTRALARSCLALWLAACTDGAARSDAASGPDVAIHGCHALPAPATDGLCLGVQRAACAAWARDTSGGTDFAAYATCAPTGTLCAAADQCAGRACTCGLGPACEPGSACGISPGETTPHCLVCSP